MSSLDDDRTTARHPRLIRGQIQHIDTTTDCTIRDLSKTGACLAIDGPTETIPNRFALLLKGEDSHQKCRVIWRSAREIGVKFE